MRLTIDTQQDSHDNIRRAIRILSEIVGEEVFSNSAEAVTKADSTPFDIFGDGGSPAAPPAAPEKSDETAAFANIFDEDSKKPDEAGPSEKAGEESKEEDKANKEKFSGMIEFY